LKDKTMPFDINDPETKAAVKSLVDAAVATAKTAAEESASALQENNRLLVKQLREAKKGQEIDPTKHAALEDKVSELEGQLSAATKDAQKASKEATAQLENLTKQLNSENGFTQKLLVENGLTEALVKAGVSAHLLPAVKAMLKDQVKIVAEGDTRKAVVGDKPLADHVSAWALTDEGKHFVTAPANSGGGAAGGAGGKGAEVKVIAAGDKAAFGDNLAELAKGSKGAVQVA
jgi:hypothetical protein